jgi:subtilisin family serine protease
MPKRAVILAILVAYLIISSGSFAKASTALVPWHSESRTPQQLTNDITTLYLTLQSVGALPLQPYPEKQQATIEDILRSKNLLIGPYFPAALAVFMCKLNPTVCTVSQYRGADRKAYLRIKWENKKDDVLILPSIDFTVSTVPKPYTKSRGERMDTIVLRKRQGCKDYDSECRQVIRNLNPRFPDVLDSGFAGEVMVPTLAVDALVPAVAEEATATAHAASLVNFLSAPSSLSTTPGPHAGQESKCVNNKSGTCYEVTPLRPRPLSASFSNYVPQISFIAKGEGEMATQPAFDSSAYSLWFDRSINWTPPPTTIAVWVGVFDTKVDKLHCAFEKGKDIDVHNRTAFALPPRSTCGTTSRLPNPVIDHGTHVAGIIAARPTQNGPGGVDPFAQVVTYEEIKSDLGYDSEVATDIADALKSHAARVLNFSFTYGLVGAGTDLIEERIRDDGDNILVVAAADESKALIPSKSCDLRPACLSYPNVITVTALDSALSNPGLWNDSDNIHGADYGMGVDIGAPGERIYSSVTDDEYGQMSGTSQATAIVSGAASLFFARNQTLKPWWVKSRLIYTSDLFDSLSDKVLGGRLNVGKSIDYDSDIVSTQRCGEIKGNLAKIGKLSYVRPGDSDIKDVDINRLVRLHRLANGLYTLFVAPVEEGNNLEPIKAVKIVNQPVLELYGSHAQPIPCKGQLNDPVSLPFWEVNDYYASLKTLIKAAR